MKQRRFSRRTKKYGGPDQRTLKAKSLSLRAYQYKKNSWTGANSAVLKTIQTDIVDNLGGLIQGDPKHTRPNPWKYRVRLHTWARGATYRTFVVGGKEYYETITGTQDTQIPESKAIPGPFIDLNHFNAALSKYYDKVRGGLDMSVAMGEAGTTARMVRNRAGANDLFKSTNAAARDVQNFLKRGLYYGVNRKVKIVKKVVGKVADYYLEWKYGWKPLMQDIYDAAEEAIRIGSGGLEKFRATHYDHLGNVKTTWNLSGNFPFTRWMERVGRKGCTITGIYYVPAVEDSAQRWMSYNPASTAYELVPLSFVFDWFYNFGNYLRDMESAFLYQSRFRGGFISYFAYCDAFVTINGSSDSIPSGQPPTTSFVAQDVRMSLRYAQAERVVMVDSPTPTAPRCNLDLRSGDLLTLAGLMAQQWKKYM